jgi:hypothetical protein
VAKSFDLKFDLSQLEKEFGFYKNINKHLADAIDNLAGQAYEKAIELAQQKLKSRRDIFLNNLEFKKEGSGNNAVYVILLNDGGMWVEDGVPAHNMKDTHLKGKDKVIIPFNHNKMQPSMMPPKQQQLYKEVKSFLKKQKMPLGKTINDNSGKPILSSPGNVKPAATFNNVPSSIKSKKSGESVLNRLNVYQTATQGKDGKQKITKTAMTFRTLSKNSGDDEWNVPDLKAAHILDEVYSWILQNYEKILMEKLPDLIIKGQ